MYETNQKNKMKIADKWTSVCKAVRSTSNGQPLPTFTCMCNYILGLRTISAHGHDTFVRFIQGCVTLTQKRIQHNDYNNPVQITVKLVAPLRSRISRYT